MPFQSTGSLKSKESLASYKQLTIILNFLISYFPNLMVEVNLSEERILQQLYKLVDCIIYNVS
jgi:hypothetical protein